MIMVLRLLETEFGCLGILMKEGHPFCWTLEDHEKMLVDGKYKVVKKGNQIEIITPDGAAFFTCGHVKEEADENILLGFKVYSPRYITDTQKAVSEFYKVVKNLKDEELIIRRLSCDVTTAGQ